MVSSFLPVWAACEKQQEVQDLGGLSPACCVALGDVITKCLSFPSLRWGSTPQKGFERLTQDGRAVLERGTLPSFPSTWGISTDVIFLPSVCRGGGWCPLDGWPEPGSPVPQRPPECTA